MMTPNRAVLVTGLYTLTPLHCGTGQASGAVDLPVAREAHTGLPIVPGTTIKGIVRDTLFEQAKPCGDVEKRLFGPRPPGPRQNGAAETSGSSAGRGDDPEEQRLTAGDLVFLDGFLLAFPVRSLTGGFRLVTSPLLTHRLRRIAQAYGESLDTAFQCPALSGSEALLGPASTGPLSLEDLVFAAAQCRQDPQLATLADAFGRLVANDDSDEDRKALARRLVVVDDAVLQDLTRRATSVAARIVLTDKKTSGNLWYEETVPPDCLFAVVVGGRPGAIGAPVADLAKELTAGEQFLQIGGNASVGCGQCRWVVPPQPEVLA